MEEVAWPSGLRCWTRDLEVPGSNPLSILWFVLNSPKFNSSTPLCKLTRLVRLPLVEILISVCSIGNICVFIDSQSSISKTVLNTFWHLPFQGPHKIHCFCISSHLLVLRTCHHQRYCWPNTQALWAIFCSISSLERCYTATSTHGLSLLPSGLCKYQVDNTHFLFGVSFNKFCTENWTTIILRKRDKTKLLRPQCNYNS